MRAGGCFLDMFPLAVPLGATWSVRMLCARRRVAGSAPEQARHLLRLPGVRTAPRTWPDPVARPRRLSPGAGRSDALGPRAAGRAGVRPGFLQTRVRARTGASSEGPHAPGGGCAEVRATAGSPRDLFSGLGTLSGGVTDRQLTSRWKRPVPCPGRACRPSSPRTRHRLGQRCSALEESQPPANSIFTIRLKPPLPLAAVLRREFFH